VSAEWEPGRWWRVLRNGTVWCETSDEDEARASMSEGDTLWRLYERHERRWTRDFHIRAAGGSGEQEESR
jgi:hypothetical protein